MNGKFSKLIERINANFPGSWDSKKAEQIAIKVLDEVGELIEGEGNSAEFKRGRGDSPCYSYAESKLGPVTLYADPQINEDEVIVCVYKGKKTSNEIYEDKAESDFLGTIDINSKSLVDSKGKIVERLD